MARVDIVAHALAYEVVGEREAVEPVCGENVPAAFEIVLVAGFRHVEMVCRKGDFKTLVAHFFRKGREVFEFHIGPLAGKQSQRSCHSRFPLFVTMR